MKLPVDNVQFAIPLDFQSTTYRRFKVEVNHYMLDQRWGNPIVYHCHSQ